MTREWDGLLRGDLAGGSDGGSDGREMKKRRDLLLVRDLSRLETHPDDSGRSNVGGLLTQPLHRALLATGQGVTLVASDGPTPVARVRGAIARDQSQRLPTGVAEHDELVNGQVAGECRIGFGGWDCHRRDRIRIGG